jgi:predicted component of type VI protein secretion system
LGRSIDGDHPYLSISSDQDEATMNYVLQVVRGRSANTTLKLADGVTSVGRHDDCWIRIKSSQVSRRHCEIFESGGKLTIRDLGSSNGTYVNGKRVLGQQALTAGDELTLGAVTLRVAKLGQAAVAATPQAPSVSKPKAGDTAVVDAIPADDADDEFEMEFEPDEPEVELDVIPLADDETATAAPKSNPSGAKAGAAAARTAAEKKPSSKPSPSPAADSQGDEAIAQFLSDLKLDEDE